MDHNRILNNPTYFTLLFLTFCILVPTESFIVSTSKGYRKCFRTDVSPDKTMEVKFAFPRRERQDCQVKLQINLINKRNYINPGENVQNQNFYSGNFQCFKMNPREAYVYKHTPAQTEYSGAYEICIDNINNFGNNQTLVQLTISQRFDPSLYAEAHANTPLVQSQELRNIESIVMNIKRSLSYCQNHTREAEDIGDRLAEQIDEADSLATKALYFQLIFLVLYGVIWILFAWGLYRKMKK